MTIVFDLDYTLLDTARFKTALEKCMDASGIAPSAFRSAYSTHVEQGSRIRDFDPERLVESLADEMTCDPAEAMKKISEVAEGARAYLFPGVKRLLERLRSDGHHLVLLTHGNPEWQNLKIDGSGLEPYFDRVLVTGGAKEVLRESFDGMGEGVIMVNDNGEEMSAMKERWPKAHMIAVRGPKGLPEDPDMRTADTMEEIYDIISEV